MQKTIVVVGLILVLVGVGWPVLTKMPFGRLPGDIVINRPGFKLYVPVTSAIMVSVILSILIRIFRR